MDKDLFDDLESLGVEEPLLQLQSQPTAAPAASAGQPSSSNIDQFLEKPRLPEHNTGRVEEDPEYGLIVNANSLIVDLDSETLIVHTFIKDRFELRFNGLQKLVPNPLDYAHTVKMIGNEVDLTKLDFRSILPSATIMVVTVTSTTSMSGPLPEAEINAVLDACDIAIELDSAKRKILEYVQSRMNFIAPNLTAILGSGVAARLMGVAGGLTALSKIPSCNILVLGAQKKTNTGMSRVFTGRHAGIVYQCDTIQQLPDEYRRKAARGLSAKCALAARIDCVRECVDGSMGREYLRDLEKKIEVMLQPPPGKKTKALVIPDETRKKRRGGKRVRKQKDLRMQTELRKQQNRMAFGQAEEEIGFDGDETIGMGMIGKQTGKLRTVQADSRLKVTVSKKHRAFASHSANTSGLASSVAFTPIKGIELENPDFAAQKVKEANSKYFSGAFLKPLPKKPPQ
eukprot:jgi/Hompol1/6738/HPOL_001545-RA